MVCLHFIFIENVFINCKISFNMLTLQSVLHLQQNKEDESFALTWISAFVCLCLNIDTPCNMIFSFLNFHKHLIIYLHFPLMKISFITIIKIYSIYEDYWILKQNFATSTSKFFFARDYLGLFPAPPFSWMLDSRAKAIVGRSWFSLSERIFFCDWFCADKSKEENCFRGKREGVE